MYNVFAYEKSYVLFMEDLACLNLFMDFLVDKRFFERTISFGVFNNSNSSIGIID